MSETVVRVGGYAPRESVHSLALDHFADFIEKRSNGDVRVEITHNVMDGGGKATKLFDMVRSGELTWCYYSSSYLGASVRGLNAIEIPFIFSSLEDAHKALDGTFGDTIAAEVLDVEGFEVLGFWDNGFRHLTNSVRPLEEPKDCTGLSIRLQPNHIHQALARSWGMKPVTAELSAGIAMIAAGEVDAQENPLGNTFAYGVTHRFITLSAHLYGARGLFANPASMNAFGRSVGEMVREGAREAIDFQRSAAIGYEGELREKFESEGRTIFEPSQAARERFKEAARGVISAARLEADQRLLDLLSETA